MSGGISFSSEKSWIVATWVYRHLTQYTQKHVSKDSFPNLHNLLSEDENPIHFILYEELTSEERLKLFSAIQLAYNDIIKDNGEGFVNREYFLNYLDRLNELMEMLPNEK